MLPDVLANAGGVVVSYFEWVQGLQEYFWTEDEVNAKLHDIVVRAFEETWHTARSSRRACAWPVRARRSARRRGDHDAGPLPVSCAQDRNPLARSPVAQIPVAAARSRSVRARSPTRHRLPRRDCGSARRSRSSEVPSVRARASTSPATPSSRRATASWLPVSRSTGSARSRTSSSRALRRTLRSHRRRFFRRRRKSRRQNRDALSQATTEGATWPNA